MNGAKWFLVLIMMIFIIGFSVFGARRELFSRV